MARRSVELAGPESDIEEVAEASFRTWKVIATGVTVQQCSVFGALIPAESPADECVLAAQGTDSMQRSLRMLGALIVCLTIAHAAFAQGGRSEISGTIVDAGKAVLPGATVTATNEGTGLARNAVTDAGGKFTIAQLLPGTYTVSAELSGFQGAKHTGLVLAVGQTLSVSLTLEIASVKETVTVTGQAPLVEVTSSQVGTSISNTEIDGLPSANRSQFSLMQTVPGLVPVLQVGSFEGGQFSANGQSTTNNLFLVDGQADNDSRRGGSQGTQARISLDTMAEYQVETHNYGAEYGGSTGVVVNGVTKSGTNTVHGRAFEYLAEQQDRGDRLLRQDQRRREARVGQ